MSHKLEQLRDSALREIESAGLHALTKPVAPLRLRALVSQMLKARLVPAAAPRFPA